MSASTARGKFVCTSIDRKGDNHIEVALDARYDTETSNDDRAFSKATPSGTFHATITNPEVIGVFKEGRAYYLDISPVPIDLMGRTEPPADRAAEHDKSADEASGEVEHGNAASGDVERTPRPATGPEAAGGDSSGTSTPVRGGNSPITRHGG